MTDFFSAPDDTGEVRQSDLQASLGERLGAQALDTLDPKNSLSGAYIVRRMREASAGGLDQAPGMNGEIDAFGGQPLEQQQAVYDARRAQIPDTSIGDAKARVKQEGLEAHLKLPDQPSIKSPVLDLMINEAHERRDREAAIARGPQGFIPGALGAITSLGVGMIDPVNAAAFSIPVLGEARWGKLMANAGDSLMGRAGVRALQGGAQGAVGTAVLQPADWWLHTGDGQDYTMADALKSVVMGAGMGAAFHAGIGGISDVRARLGGRPLPGSPEDLLARGLMAGIHVRGEDLAETAPPPLAPGPEEIPGITADTRAVPAEVAPADSARPPEAIPPHPAEILADLPPAVQEDLVRATVADITADRPARAAEVLQIAADHDPRIAESIEAWHGSPHDFDRFDVSNIGTGEGAQSFGHGLYFAENEKVARAYQRTTSDKAFVNKVAELYDEGFSPDEAWAEIKDNWKDFTPAEQRLMTALEKDDWLGFDYPHQAVNAALRDIKAFDVSPETAAAARAVGNMYRVRINANHEHFLDWDKPLHEQSEHVKAALTKIGIDVSKHESAAELAEKGLIDSSFQGRSGESAYHEVAEQLATHKKGTPDKNGFYRMDDGRTAASQALTDAGIPGIKYLDQGSRGKGEGTRNFVVFDDKHIEITGKNGEPVKREALPAQGNAPRRDPTAAAQDPRWRELADAPPAHSAPEAIAESHAADAVAEPPSVTPKALTAIEQAATAAEEAWRKVEGSYTEAERAVVNDALAKLDLDLKEVEDLINEGAACLMAAEAA